MTDDGCAGWLCPGLSLGGELALEAARRAVPRLHRNDLEAQLDSALVDLANCREMLNQAMRRVAELELREVISQPPSDRHHAWAAEVLAGLDSDQAKRLG